MNRAFWQARIDAAEAAIAAYEAALLFFAEHEGIQSYTVDTGQTRTVVTRSDIGTINRVLDSLANRVATYEARLNGTGAVIARPGF